MIWVESIHQWFVQFEKERKQNEKKKIFLWFVYIKIK